MSDDPKQSAGADSREPQPRPLACPPGQTFSLRHFPEVKPVSRSIIITSFVSYWLGILLSVVCFVLLIFFAFKQQQSSERVRHEAFVERSSLPQETHGNLPAAKSGAGEDGSCPELRGSLSTAPVALGAISAGMLVMLLILFYHIVGLVVLYRGWKCLQPLRLIAPGKAVKMPSAGSTIALLFVPFYHFYWMFRAYRDVEKYGRQIADVMGKPYRGPSFDLARTVPILRLIGWCFLIIPFTSGLSLFVFLAESIVLYFYILRINDMVADLGKLPENVPS